jgi:hypothetical protein
VAARKSGFGWGGIGRFLKVKRPPDMVMAGDRRPGGFVKIYNTYLWEIETRLREMRSCRSGRCVGKTWRAAAGRAPT